jgi:hypothetical protein
LCGFHLNHLQGRAFGLGREARVEAKKRAKMESVLNEFPVVELSRTEILHAYAQIDAWTHGKMPPRAQNPPSVPQPAISMKIERFVDCGNGTCNQGKTSDHG